MNNFERIQEKLFHAKIDKDTAAKAAKLITQSFQEADYESTMTNWTLKLANDFIKLYADFGATEALRLLDESVIK